MIHDVLPEDRMTTTATALHKVTVPDVHDDDDPDGQSCPCYLCKAWWGLQGRRLMWNQRPRRRIEDGMGPPAGAAKSWR